jgi:hypothetical protein
MGSRFDWATPAQDVRSETVAAEALPLWRRKGGSNCSCNGAVCAAPLIAAVLGASQHSPGLVLSEGLESLCFPVGPTIHGGFINFNHKIFKSHAKPSRKMNWTHTHP